MGDFLCKELSKTNRWWLPRYRYLELRYFALQYPEWKRRYEELGSGVRSIATDILRVNGSGIVDPTADIAIQRAILSDKMKLVEQTAIDADAELYNYIIKSVTENLTFVCLKGVYDMPCERDMFYDRRRKFYWLLDKVR